MHMTMTNTNQEDRGVRVAQAIHAFLFLPHVQTYQWDLGALNIRVHLLVIHDIYCR